MGTTSSKSLNSFAVPGGSDFLDRTGGLLLSTRGETIRLNHLVRLYDVSSKASYYGVSSAERKGRDQELETKSQVYVLRLRNPDLTSPQIIYQGDRGILQLTIYENAYLETEVGHYGVVLPPVVSSSVTAFDGSRSIVRFGTMVEATEEDGQPFRTASLESVRSHDSNVKLAHMFSVHCISANDHADPQPIDRAYQQIIFTTVMDEKNNWRPPLTLTLYRFKSEFKKDNKDRIPITKTDNISRLGNDWTYQPLIKLVDIDDSDTVTLVGTVTFNRKTDEYYNLPFYDTVVI